MKEIGIFFSTVFAINHIKGPMTSITLQLCLYTTDICPITKFNTTFICFTFCRSLSGAIMSR